MKIIVPTYLSENCDINYKKGKGVPSSINEGWVPGGDSGPGPSPPQVAFSRAGAIQRLSGRSIRRTCGLPSQFLNTATRYTDESAVAIRIEFLAKGNYATADSRIDLALLQVRVKTATS